MKALIAATALGIVAGAMGVATLTLPRLHRHYTPRVAYADLKELLGLGKDPDRADPVPIDCWGDSLTEGSGASPGHDFPSVLRVVFHRAATNHGASGETSAQIKARMLSRVTRGGPEKAIIWVGRNDDPEKGDETERNVADMVGSLAPGSHYLVLGVLNRDIVRERRGGDRYDAIVALERRLAARYGSHYLPIREALIARADTGSVDDQVAVEDDVVPPSLRADPLHLDDQGQAFVAVAVESAIRRGEW